MSIQTAEVATVSAVEGRVFVIRDGVETPLNQDMTLRAGDVLRSTENSLAVLSIPGTQQQIPAFLEVANGGIAQLEFDPDLGRNGQVVVKSGTDTVDGTVTLVSDMEGDNQAAVLEGQEGQGDSFGLFGAGIAAGGGALFLPAAGAVGAAAILAGGDDDSGGGGAIPPSPTNPTDNLGGLAETVGNLTNNLGEITNPIPVVDDVVDGVGTVVTNVLAGNNNGGVAGLLQGLGEGLDAGLGGTPLAVVGDALGNLLGTVGGLIGNAATQVTGIAEGTPLAPLAGLVGSLLGAENDNPVGGVLGTVSNALGAVSDLTEPVPVLGDVVGGVGTLLDSVFTGDNNGGVSGLLTGLGEGLESALAGTPVSVFGNGANTLLGTVGGVLSGVGDSIASVGIDTPLEPVTGLLGDVVGTSDGGGLLGGIPVLDDLLSPLTDGLGLLSGGLGGGLGGGLLGGGDNSPLDGLPLVGDLLGGLTSSIGSSAAGDSGGLLGGGLLGGLKDLTNVLG
ncbi:MAG TPA: hypothetical protein VFV39_03040 [Limnobacter sp.]|nr:hypothetical protein [Limnobacter sp.]